MFLFSGVQALASLPALAARTAPSDGATGEACAFPYPLARALAAGPVAERGWREPGAAALTHRYTPGVLAVRTRRGCLVVSGDVLGAGPISRIQLVDEARALARDGNRELLATGLDSQAARAWAQLGFRTYRSGASVRVDLAAGVGPDGDDVSLEFLPASWEAPLKERLVGTVPRRALNALVNSGPGAGPVVLLRQGRRLVAVGRCWEEGGERAVHLFWCARRRGVVAGAVTALARQAREDGMGTLSVHLHRRLRRTEACRIPASGGAVTPRFTARTPGLSGILAACLA